MRIRSDEVQLRIGARLSDRFGAQFILIFQTGRFVDDFEFEFSISRIRRSKMGFKFGCRRSNRFPSLANCKKPEESALSPRKGPAEESSMCSSRFSSCLSSRISRLAFDVDLELNVLGVLKLRKFVNWSENLAEFCNLYGSRSRYNVLLFEAG